MPIASGVIFSGISALTATAGAAIVVAAFSAALTATNLFAGTTAKDASSLFRLDAAAFAYSVPTSTNFSLSVVLSSSTISCFGDEKAPPIYIQLYNHFHGNSIITFII